ATWFVLTLCAGIIPVACGGSNKTPAPPPVPSGSAPPTATATGSAPTDADAGAGGATADAGSDAAPSPLSTILTTDPSQITQWVNALASAQAAPTAKPAPG